MKTAILQLFVAILKKASPDKVLFLPVQAGSVEARLLRGHAHLHLHHSLSMRGAKRRRRKAGASEEEKRREEGEVFLVPAPRPSRRSRQG